MTRQPTYISVQDLAGVDELGRRLIAQSDTGPVCCLVLGSTDTGKTTLVTDLANGIARRRDVAIVDADVGQSRIGPPTTVGWALAEPHMSDLAGLVLRGMFFVGDISPSGHLLPMTVAIARACWQALGRAKLLIIDTGGFVNEPAAKALWWQVHHIVQPRAIIAVQRHDELEPILKGVEAATEAVYRVGCPDHVRSKSAENRQRFRAARFADYFRDRNTYKVNLAEVAVQMARPRGSIDACGLAGRLVGLRDGRGCDRALGVIVRWDDQNSVLEFVSPSLTIGEIRCIVVGDVKIDLSQL